MKKHFLILYLTISVFSLFAQNTNTYLNNYVQPAPNVAALGKYVDIPVSYYTGVPEISIPIFDLKDGAARVPISISYHASGIRVSEVASWIGLGWALNAGGMITRTVRGAPDEGSRKQSTGYGPSSYYRDSGLYKLPLMPHPTNGQIMNDASQFLFRDYAIPGASEGSLDGEPDIFSFNFNGYSGKFVFDEFKTPRLLSDDDLKITAVYSYSTALFSWIITTPEGTKYYFGENNKTEITQPHSTSSGDDVDSQLPSSWWLTRIIYPNTRDTVYFNYSPETYTYYDLGPESHLYNFLMNDHVAPWNVCANSSAQQSVIRTTVSGLQLTSIVSKNDSIRFIANTLRDDLAHSYTRSKQLDSIKIYTRLGQCLAQYNLKYSYFVSSLATNLVNLGFVSDSSDTKRLKLLSLTQYSGDASISKPPHIFQYQDSFQLPRRLSYDQDHWGYSNNPAGNYNFFFTPKIDMGTACSGGGANRDASWPQMEASALLSIRDPLGVITKFEFEPDSADSYLIKIVGGLRIHRITTIDSLTNLKSVKRYRYSSGVLFHFPKYVIILNNEFYLPPAISGISPGYQGYGSQFIPAVLKQSQSIVPLQDFQGNNVGYGFVQEYFGENGEGGSKAYTYSLNLSSRNNSRLDFSNYTSSQSMATIFYGTITATMGNAHFNDILPENLQYYSGYDIDRYYPFAPDQIDLRRGKLLHEYTYDSSGILLRDIGNTYREVYHENQYIRGFKVFRIPQYERYNAPNFHDAITFYKLHTGKSYLIATTEKDYKDGKVITSTSRYGYESAFHTLRTSDSTVNSQGDSIITKTFYSFDYANNATADTVFGKLKNRNILVPVATRVWKNNQLISGTVTSYKDFATNAADSFINPLKIYSLETTAPLTIAQAGENIALTGQFSTLLPNSYFKEKASFTINNTTGKIIEQKLVNDKNQTLIWENNYSLPLAQVENALFSDVAFSSFETAESGNWTYSSSSVVSEPTAPTGSKGYNISGGISKSGLVAAQKYIISYWLKSGGSVSITGGTQTNNVTGRVLNGWTYKQVTITGTTSLTISGTGSIDELRLHPSIAQMNTYTYDALMRLIATSSANNTISYYEYDSMNRVTDIKDQYGNVIKAFEYNYGRLSRPGQ